jgi:hypothetical protein
VDLPPERGQPEVIGQDHGPHSPAQLNEPGVGGGAEARAG